jgi:hypothetical protein
MLVFSPFPAAVFRRFLAKSRSTRKPKKGCSTRKKNPEKERIAKKNTFKIQCRVLPGF